MTPYKEKDIITILGNIPVFQGLAEADYAEIMPLLKLERFPSGVHIIREGARGDSMCVIISGAVKITKTGEAGEEILLDTFYTGSYFGEFSLVDSMPRSANAVSLEETEVFRLKKRDFDSLLAKNGAIATAFYKNCLEETFSRFRNTIANFAFSEHSLRQKSTELEELDRDLSQARQIQSYFINRELLDHEHSFLRNVRHTYVYRPCIAIGGDFLNVTELRPGVASIIIADIMGHGITSALGTGVLKSAYSMAVRELGFKPIQLMKFLNRHFLGVISHLYATCYYAIIDMRNRKIQLAKAGHPHPLFWKKRRRDFVDIQCQGTGLGLVKKARFGRVSYPLERGDRILFYTDGIIEQKNPRGQMYTESRLRSVFRDLILHEDADIVKKIHEDMKSFAGRREIEDDVTLLLLEF